MNRIQHIFINALLIGSAFFFLSHLSFAQENVIELLEGSEELRLDGKSGNYIIKGNVVFKKEGAKLYCDSAYYNIVKEHIYAYSNVHLNQNDTLNMYCDSLFFDAKREYAKLWGDVRVRDNEYKLNTDSLDYDIKSEMGVYKNGGVISSISSSERLTSKIGYFFPKLEQFNFRKDVIYKSDQYEVTTDTLQFNGRSKKASFYGPSFIRGDGSTMYCESGWYDINKDEGELSNNAYIDRKEIYISGDSLFYSAQDSLYVGVHNVIIRDTANQLEFQGDYAINDGRRRESLITGHAIASKIEKTDTLFIHADSLFASEDSLQEPSLILAYNDVEIVKGDMSGICDSLVYDKPAGIMHLFTNPFLWAKDAQLSGDTISVFEKNDKLEKAFIRDKGLIVTSVKETDYYNQVNGSSMTAYFDSTSIQKVDIEKNAKTIYYLEDESSNDTVTIVERKGMNRLYASGITLYFSEGDITGATYRSNPDGILYPMDQINSEEEKTPDFKWNPGIRPVSPEFMSLNPEEKAFVLQLFHWSLTF